ncbi:hypothetical protein LV89_02015 [Arcicella aurantiaca]|uniref:Uncharacterized protein n=1 Tax=Arcicella aurantiaca TaxID=591202 RepID=A0A316E9M6_9BACT|nr:hypothetical protein [Arcicella aurantiaca]PWK27200.1 hypothetical protein LV89_02015 [Arcicella aurantiaca]
MRHWTECLHEGKRIYRDDVDRLMSLQKEMQDLEMKRFSLLAEISEQQAHIYLLTVCQYSIAEIADAMTEFDSHFEQ